MADYSNNETIVLNTPAESLLSHPAREHQSCFTDSRASSIPPEILELILSNLRDDSVLPDACSEENLSTYSEYTRQTVLTWITVTHVCSSWRNMAIDYPALWTRIPLNLGPSWTKALLSRPYSHPISIVAHSPLDLRAIQPVIGFLSRIQSIHVTAEPDTIKALLESLTEPAPLLRSLTLYSNDSRVGLLNLPQVKETLFDGEAPLLRDVRIANCNFSLDSIALQNFCDSLTTLHLTLTKDDTRIDPEDPDIHQWENLDLSLQNFLMLLRQMPLLEVLQVRNVPRIDNFHVEQASLPSLRSLMLMGGFLTCLTLNEKIVGTQPDIFLGIQCFMVSPNAFEEHITFLSDMLTQHISRRSPDILSSQVDIEIDDCHFKFSVEGVCSLEGPVPEGWESDRDWMIQLSIYALPLAASTILNINIRTRVDADALIMMLGTDWIREDPVLVKPITSLTVTGFDSGFVLEELCTALEADQQVSPPAILPLLSSLCITSFNFEGLRPNQCVTCQEVILQMLDTRNQVGQPVRRLELRNWKGMDRRWYEDLAAKAAGHQTTVRAKSVEADGVA